MCGRSNDCGSVEKIATADLSLDRLTKDYIRSHLSHRFIEVPSDKDAFASEREVQAGTLSAGRPWLNPALIKPRIVQHHRLGDNLFQVGSENRLW